MGRKPEKVLGLDVLCESIETCFNPFVNTSPEIVLKYWIVFLAYLVVFIAAVLKRAVYVCTSWQVIIIM